MEICIVLNSRSYDFTDDQGKIVKGSNVTYLTGDVEASTQLKGVSTMTVSATDEVMSQLQELPGVYELDFKQRPGKNNRPTLTLTACKFMKALTGFLQPVQPGQEANAI
jgi:hypothetical protein